MYDLLCGSEESLFSGPMTSLSAFIFQQEHDTYTHGTASILSNRNFENILPCLTLSWQIFFLSERLFPNLTLLLFYFKFQKGAFSDFIVSSKKVLLEKHF